MLSPAAILFTSLTGVLEQGESLSSTAVSPTFVCVCGRAQPGLGAQSCTHNTQLAKGALGEGEESSDGD